MFFVNKSKKDIIVHVDASSNPERVGSHIVRPDEHYEATDPMTKGRVTGWFEGRAVPFTIGRLGARLGARHSRVSIANLSKPTPAERETLLKSSYHHAGVHVRFIERLKRPSKRTRK